MAKLLDKKYRFLAVSNLILLALLLASVIHEQYIQRLYKRLTVKAQPATFADNPAYQQEVSFYPLYQQQKNIVLLGDSYITNVHWPELLQRCDVAARGVSNDQTAGMLARLDAILTLQPKICFVEGGNNDVAFDSTGAIIAKNLNSITDTLLKHGIIPVLHTINPIASFVPGADTINTRIRLANQQINRLANSKNIHLIDLYHLYTDKGALSSAFCLPDGAHLNRKAYELWRQEIWNILKQEGL